MKLIQFKGGSIGVPVWICPDQVVRVSNQIEEFSEPPVSNSSTLVLIDLINGQAQTVEGKLEDIVAILTKDQ